MWVWPGVGSRLPKMKEDHQRKALHKREREESKERGQRKNVEEAERTKKGTRKRDRYNYEK